MGARALMAVFAAFDYAWLALPPCLASEPFGDSFPFRSIACQGIAVDAFASVGSVVLLGSFAALQFALYHVGGLVLKMLG